MDIFDKFRTRNQEENMIQRQMYVKKNNDTRINSDDTKKLMFGLEEDMTIYIYGIFVLGVIITGTLKNILLSKICKNSSFNIHNSMIDCVTKAPMRFFDTNPSGRILNRFSKDLGAVDEILSMAMIESFQVLSINIGVAVQILIINWWLIFPMIIVFYTLLFIKNIYLATAQKIKRLEGNGTFFF